MQSDVKFLLTGMPEYCGQNELSVRTFEPVFAEDAPTDYVHLHKMVFAYTDVTIKSNDG